MPADLYRSPIPEQLWERIRNEYSLPTLEQVHERLTAVQEDPDPVMQQLFRVFVGEETYCPGFQFRPDLSLDPAVVELFERALALRIPHNYFALWMMVPSPALQGKRPVDLQHRRAAPALTAALERAFTSMAA
ncbi:hypothetical protein ACIQTW_20420 [Paenarthrobacter sp. NPDC090517]|uniref:hypothetical protein n=1 Tax=Paenarthrobacter sp. NPDC090517 TaxID=3364381 RepID=UPI00382A257D